MGVSFSLHSHEQQLHFGHISTPHWFLLLPLLRTVFILCLFSYNAVKYSTPIDVLISILYSLGYVCLHSGLKPSFLLAALSG